MKKHKLVNKTFQPFQLIINNDVTLLSPRGTDNYVYVNEITTQMKKLANKGLIKITKPRK